MHIRRLTPHDAPAYRALMLDAYATEPTAFTSSIAEREPLPLAWWQQRLDDGDPAREAVLGAFAGERLVGVVGLAFETREKLRHKATLFGMVVERALRGQGLARRLVEAALAVARSRAGLQLLQLTVTDGNRAAQALYAACGFAAYGVEPLALAVDGGHVAKVHMWLDLRVGTAATPRHD